MSDLESVVGRFDDERVAVVATNSILDRELGKPVAQQENSLVSARVQAQSGAVAERSKPIAPQWSRLGTCG